MQYSMLPITRCAVLPCTKEPCHANCAKPVLTSTNPMWWRAACMHISCMCVPHMRLPSRCSQSSKHRHGTVWQPFALSASSVLGHHDKAKSSPTELVHADCHTQSCYKFGRGQSQAVKRFRDNGVKIHRATCHVSREDYYGAAITWERHK